MNSDEKALRFFLGVNTPQGFVSRYDQLTDHHADWRTLIIKGGPGCGKSTLMQKVAQSFAEEPLELAHCSSDADSIDAVICPGRRFALADGTYPHVLEPKYPGAAETLLDLTGCWNEDALYACRADIIALSDRISRCHDHACRFLGAAASLVGDTYRLALDAVNTAKLSAYCARLCEREFKATGGEGRESIRFLSAVTNKGPLAFTETAKSLCERVYIVKDDCGAVSRLLLNRIRAAALACGHSLICCYCPLSPFEKLEHIFIPKLKLGFMTSNRFHDFAESMEAYRYVNSQRFSDQQKMKSGKHRITFNRKAAAQMLEQAAELLAEAKALHDELETYYIAATDFAKTDLIAEKTLQKLQKYPVM